MSPGLTKFKTAEEVLEVIKSLEEQKVQMTVLLGDAVRAKEYQQTGRPPPNSPVVAASFGKGNGSGHKYATSNDAILAAQMHGQAALHTHHHHRHHRKPQHEGILKAEMEMLDSNIERLKGIAKQLKLTGRY